MSKMNFSQWVKKNQVALVIVPLIVGIHWGWYELQKDPYLVPPSERKTEMPIISAFKKYSSRISQNIENFINSGSEK